MEILRKLFRRLVVITAIEQVHERDNIPAQLSISICDAGFGTAEPVVARDACREGPSCFSIDS